MHTGSIGRWSRYEAQFDVMRWTLEEKGECRSAATEWYASPMADESTARPRRLSPEFWAIVAVGVTLFGQAALQNNRVNDRIDRLQEGQAVIRERLAAVEGQVGTARTANAGELAVVVEDAVSSQTP